MKHRSTRSNLELRGPRNGLKLDPRSSRGAFCTAFRAGAESGDERCCFGAPWWVTEGFLGGSWGASKRVIRRASRCKVHLWISLLALLYRADVRLAALGHHTISRNQHAVRTMVINSVVDLTAGDSSDDALSYELSNHILKMKSCLRAKGFLRRPVALAWPRPISVHGSISC